MPISPEIILKLAHGGLKPLQTLLDLLEFYDMDSKGGLHSPETRKSFSRSIGALAQGIRDLRLIAICDEISNVNDSINWKKLIEHNLPRSPSTNFGCEGNEGEFEGKGHPEMLASAISNMGWFANQFWSTPPKIKLSSTEKEGGFWFDVDWNFGNTITVDPNFSTFLPYFPMFPKKSLSLDNSTGLVLYAVKRILELHGGSLTANVTDNLIVRWSCPKELRPEL